MTLAFSYISREQIIIISKLRFDFFYLNKRKTAFTFKKGDLLVFAKFLKVEEREMIIVINERLQLLMFDLTKLRHEILTHE